MLENFLINYFLSFANFRYFLGVDKFPTIFLGLPIFGSWNALNEEHTELKNIKLVVFIFIESLANSIRLLNGTVFLQVATADMRYFEWSKLCMSLGFRIPILSREVEYLF